MRVERAVSTSLLLLVAALSAACGDIAPAEEIAATDTPKHAYPQVVLEDGSAIDVEVALTPEARARGLMYRRVLPPRHGMLFLFPRPEVQKFWMKNTVIPLDIIWLDEELRVIELVTAPPCEIDPCPSFGPDEPAAYVLEISGGEARKLGIAEGSRMTLRNIPRQRGS